ncbi:hypothetical protein [Nocardia sp. NPDC057030]|uniref:hypothetical protein n=1 Tax=unclassified Nocardia TaxID=2637762 RepID=UPI00364359DD
MAYTDRSRHEYRRCPRSHPDSGHGEPAAPDRGLASVMVIGVVAIVLIAAALLLVAMLL